MALVAQHQHHHVPDLALPQTRGQSQHTVRIQVEADQGLYETEEKEDRMTLEEADQVWG